MKKFQITNIRTRSDGDFHTFEVGVRFIYSDNQDDLILHHHRDIASVVAKSAETVEGCLIQVGATIIGVEFIDEDWEKIKNWAQMTCEMFCNRRI